MSLLFASIAELSEQIRSRRISPVELVHAELAHIERLNPLLNAFITVTGETALRAAKSAESEIAAGRWRGPLHGVPVGIKDMFDTEGIRTTAAFALFERRVPSRDAASVAALKRAGAIIVGKTNLHRLAMGTTSAVSDFGAVHNPWNRDRIAGGSSGGSAAAIAAGMCYATLDTDAIGSCRLPAACCGVTGFKGSYGLLPTEGILAGEPVDPAILRLGHAAITARTSDDVSLVLEAITPWSGAAPPDRRRPDERRRIGRATNYAADKEVKPAFATAAAVFEALGELVRTEAPLDNPGFNVAAIESDRRAIVGSLFADCDFVILPTNAAATPCIEEVSEPLALSPRNTMFANYYGLPAVSIPCGLDARGLPLGVQIIGRPGEDRAVLTLAAEYEEARWGKGQTVGHPSLATC
ncbi:MAG: amidase [Xanthobacteraceae bacterium]